MDTTNTRQAYIARQPGKSGAFGYINREIIHTPGAKQLLEQWIERGAEIIPVSLDEAIEELSRYGAEQRLPVSVLDDLPMMFRRQAD